MREETSRRACVALVATALVALFATEANAQLGALFGRKEAVPEIKIDQLRQLKLDESKEDSPYVLVDVRSPEESSVSLIPGAITKLEYEKNQARYAGRKVIAYCTSGYRSEQYTRELIRKGVDATNFKGSILQWCRANLPVVSPEGRPTNRVHTYSSGNKVPAQYQAVW